MNFFRYLTSIFILAASIRIRCPNVSVGRASALLPTLCLGSIPRQSRVHQLRVEIIMVCIVLYTDDQFIKQGAI